MVVKVAPGQASLYCSGTHICVECQAVSARHQLFCHPKWCALPNFLQRDNSESLWLHLACCTSHFPLPWINMYREKITTINSPVWQREERGRTQITGHRNSGIRSSMSYDAIPRLDLNSPFSGCKQFPVHCFLWDLASAPWKFCPYPFSHLSTFEVVTEECAILGSCTFFAVGFLFLQVRK